MTKDAILSLPNSLVGNSCDETRTTGSASFALDNDSYRNCLLINKVLHNRNVPTSFRSRLDSIYLRATIDMRCNCGV